MVSIADAGRVDELLSKLHSTVVERDKCLKSNLASEVARGRRLSVVIYHLIIDCVKAGASKSVLYDMAAIPTVDAALQTLERRSSTTKGRL